jgi:hypothetical protein
MTMFFGPLDKSSCVYFLIITMIFFFLLVVGILTNIVWLINNYKKANIRTLTGGLIIIFNAFLAYFVNRLLYTMCSKSLA